MSYLILGAQHVTFDYAGYTWHEFTDAKSGAVHCFQLEATDKDDYLVLNMFAHSVGWLIANGYI